MRYLHALIILISTSGAVLAEQSPSNAPAPAPDGVFPYLLAQDSENGNSRPRRENANLQMPAPNAQYQEGERCMTVCSGWGEECVMLDSGDGRTGRKCVRTCTSFSKECL